MRIKKYKVSSGNFSIITYNKNAKCAANRAMRLHHESRHHSVLGKITMVEDSLCIEKTLFFSTKTLILEHEFLLQVI